MKVKWPYDLPTEETSKRMRAVRREHSEPELRLRKALWSKGARYRLHRKIGITKPDIVFVSQFMAIFVDGCFWHGCPKHFRTPATNEEFWSAKIAANRAKDRRQTKYLRKAGWTVKRYWECQIRSRPEAIADAVVAELHLGLPQ
jgi:DNA mismatch endonuclease (patch repair protein)